MSNAPARDRLLRVNLHEGTVASETVPASWLTDYLGGKGLGARYLYDELDPGVDPLGGDNRLLLLAGPCSGALPGEVRLGFITKSPLTGLFLDSYIGGTFATALVDALESHIGLLIEGEATDPTALHVDAGGGKLEPAEHLWGLSADALAEAVDEPVAGPGPAGEAGVRFATVAADGGDHQAGRGGTGAVMGAKRLKAIVAGDGTGVGPDLQDLRQQYADRFEERHRGRWHRRGGTVETVDAADAAGVLPTDGWRSGAFDGADAIGVDALRARAAAREPGDVPGDFTIEDPAVVPRGALAISLGANLGIDDLDAVLGLGRLCDQFGLDVIETGNALAWAMRAAEDGVIEAAIEPGDAEGARQLLEAIAHRSTPLGRTLGDGIEAAVDRYGGADLIPTVKSMTAATYEPRPAIAMALAYATSDRGACHRRSRPVFAEVLDGDDWTAADRVEAVIREQNRRSLLWCYIVDDVTAPAFEADLGRPYLEALGFEHDRRDLETIGERVWTLTRLFNVREGISAADDALPAAFTIPLETGPTAGAAIDAEQFQALRHRYYATRGWGGDGRPTRRLLDRVGLGDVVDDATPIARGPASAPNRDQS